MKTASTELANLINNSNQFIMTDLLTIITVSGLVLRYTSADKNITFSGNTFVPFVFERGNTRLVIGTQVDTLSLVLHGGLTTIVSSIPMPQFTQNGGFDGAEVTLYKAFLPDWNSAPTGGLLMFKGKVSDVEPSRTVQNLTVKSDLELFNVQMPRNLYQASCLHTVYDAGCGINKAAWANNRTVASGSDTRTLNCTLTQANGYFDQGFLIFTSGQNAGAYRTVKSYVVGQLRLSLALPFAPSVGDAFTVYRGCNGSLQTCNDVFNNKIKFRGYPFIPIPESAI